MQCPQHLGKHTGLRLAGGMQPSNPSIKIMIKKKALTHFSPGSTVHSGLERPLRDRRWPEAARSLL